MTDRLDTKLDEIEIRIGQPAENIYEYVKLEDLPEAKAAILELLQEERRDEFERVSKCFEVPGAVISPRHLAVVIKQNLQAEYDRIQGLTKEDKQ